MVDTYDSGKKTVCFNCKDRHPGCHNCEKRKKEIEQEQAAKTELKKHNMVVTAAFEKKVRPRKKKSTMGRNT